MFALWVAASAVLAWLWTRVGDGEGNDMGRIGVTDGVVSGLDIRRAIQASNDLDALERLRRRGFEVATDGVRVTGRKGPAWAFSTKARPR